MTAAGTGRLAAISAQCQLRDRHQDVTAFELSEKGCCLDVGPEFLSADDFVILVFQGNIRVFAKVLHTANRGSKVAFEPPMHPGVLSHLLTSNREVPRPAAGGHDAWARGARRAV